MRNLFLTFIFTLSFSLISSAQTVFTAGGSMSAMLIPPPFKTDVTPLGFGGFGKVFWQTGDYDCKFIEAGGEKFQFIWADTRRSFSWSYLRLVFGHRKFFGSNNGPYVEYNVGFNGLLTSGYTKDETFHPGAGAGLGTGYSGKILSIGVNFNCNYNQFSEASFMPLLYVGLNFSKTEKRKNG